MGDRQNYIHYIGLVFYKMSSIILPHPYILYKNKGKIFCAYNKY